jgi:probable F420-dependent oxidoreductase
MKVYTAMDPRLPLSDIVAYARRVEAMGFDGLHVAETVHDSLAVSVLVAEHTERMVIRTSVALAFVRSPTLTAYAAWDLAKLSAGRFQLGLGTQIRQNIEDRMGMPWTAPVERMREYIEALATLYESFRTGGELCYEGEVYRLTRLQPYFNPGPDPGITPPPTWLGGVNAGICQLAGELAAGFVTHPTSSDPRYLSEICLPNLRAGARRSGRDRADVELVVGAVVVAGGNTEEVAAERERQRRMLAFLYSTPAYRRTLELYGREDLAGQLRTMIRQDRWDDLADLVSDELLDTLLPAAAYDELAALLLDRYGALADGILLPAQGDPAHDDEVTRVVAELQAT